MSSKPYLMTPFGGIYWWQTAESFSVSPRSWPIWPWWSRMVSSRPLSQSQVGPCKRFSGSPVLDLHSACEISTPIPFLLKTPPYFPKDVAQSSSPDPFPQLPWLAAAGESSPMSLSMSNVFGGFDGDITNQQWNLTASPSSRPRIFAKFAAVFSRSAWELKSGRKAVFLGDFMVL